MSRALGFDLSGLGIRIDGLPGDAAERLADEWRAFAVDDPPDPLLRVAARVAPRDGAGETFRPKAMRAEFGADDARFEMPHGEARVDGRGQAQIVVGEGLGSTGYFTFMNFLRACLAWRLPSRGAAMLHAAGLVVRGRAWLLVGSEGAGKTTWARVGERAGARPLSDDLVLVAGAADGLWALGSPLRSTLERDYRPGRWPLGGILFPRHGSPAALAPCGALLARARLAANLPFVAAAVERDARVAAVLERLAGDGGCRELTFAPEPSFVDLLVAADPGDG